MATFIMGGLGAIIGGAAGGPAGAWKGWQIGAAVGGIIDALNQPKPSFDVGRLSDLRYSGSTYGVTIPRVWGRARVSGNVVWCAEDANGNHLIEHSRSVGGGGGGGSNMGGGGGGGTEYWATATFAVAFCAGTLTMPDGSQVYRAPQLKRLWADDKLIYEAGSSANVVNPVWHSGSESQDPDGTIVASLGAGIQNTPAFAGIAYAVLVDMDLHDFSNRIPNFSAEVETSPVTAGDVISDICRSAGIAAADIDVSLATVQITGKLEEGMNTAQESLADVLLAYNIDLVEVDGKIRAVPRGSAPSFAIAEDDMGAGSLKADILAKRLPMVQELPSTVNVHYFDVDAAYERGMQFDTRHATGSNRTEQVHLNLSLTKDEARRMAARILDTKHHEAKGEFETSVPMRYLKIAPTDVGTITRKGRQYRVRVRQEKLAPLGPIKLSMVMDGAQVVQQSIGGGEGGNGGTGTLTVVPTVFRAWSGKEILEEHKQTAGFYVAATAGSGWQGASVHYSLDGTNWIQGPAVTGKSIFGEATSALSDSGAIADQFDDANSVQVDISASGGELVGATDEEIRNGDNHAVLGSEILGYGTATLDAPGLYTLEHLRRGERGSSMGGHAAGDLFVRLSQAVVRVPVPESYIGQTVQVKVVSRYQDINDVTAQSVVIAPRSLTQNEEILEALLTPTYIAPVTVFSGTGPVAWTTYNASASMPIGAKVAILEVEIASAGDGNVQARKDGSSSAYIIGRVSEGAGSAQSTIPCTSSRTFDYQINDGPGVIIRLIGYWS